MATYYELCGGNKKLSEIVVAGSHDAAITSGASNVQTQNLDIYEQAMAGVRVYDLRICAIKNGNSAELVSYHSGWKSERSTKVNGLKTSKLRVGASSMALDDVLTQATVFVNDKPTEFLILKFDKCTNWGAIATQCVRIAGSKLFTQAGNINLRTLDELKGKVVVVFSEKGLEKAAIETNMSRQQLNACGIFGFKNLYSKDSPSVYDANYSGLQYLGKGGTSVKKVWSSSTDKTQENFKKQLKIMTEMAGEIPENGDVVGMMYWTSTGLRQSIQERNQTMWLDGGQGMQGLWNDCLEQHLTKVCQSRYRLGPIHVSSTPFKTFLPNIVMIDFANIQKCDAIKALNNIANVQIAKAMSVEPTMYN
ncbi:hypothetical protein [Agaribacter marinus]|uniref:Phosphatidylinositol diacylglycerol-lyase n=1 Tax=Agaribacter marinus TaxID=1431249 RepID=A0AA37T4L6_9ALTE|nr:hypothetical protein [Agaribacter marinus]GLR71963.1 hypothetical protein GCM10007852_28710 [Agaribacter marinus]